MKAVSAYTCKDDFGDSYVVVTDSGDHIPFSCEPVDVFKGTDMGGYFSLNPDEVKNLTSIVPAELPEEEA